MADLTPRPEGQLTQAQREQQIAALKADTVIPLLEAARDVIQQWAKDGTLHQEMHGRKLSGLINDIAKLLTAAQPRGPLVIVPQPAAGDAKDPSWFRAHSAVNLTEAERRKRQETVDAEIVEKP